MLVLLICSFYVLCVECEVTLGADHPSFKVEVSQPATLKCCYKTSEKENIFWVKSFQQHANKTVRVHHLHDTVTRRERDNGHDCAVLTLSSTTLKDTGFYRCFLNVSKVLTHGTYLQVYKPLEKTIQLSESVKNGILTAEGILLLLCVVLPSITLLFKSKRLNDLEKKKMNKLEEENIYQGLNLDDCLATYDQIEHLQGQEPYEDVGNNDEDIQLEKP